MSRDFTLGEGGIWTRAAIREAEEVLQAPSLVDAKPSPGKPENTHFSGSRPLGCLPKAPRIPEHFRRESRQWSSERRWRKYRAPAEIPLRPET